MKNWFLLLVPLLCIACSDAPPGGQGVPESDASAQRVAPANENGEPVQAGIVTEVVDYTVDGKPFTGYLAYDANIDGKRPGVLVVHEWWGHNEYARTRAVQLAQMGYTAFALDMYGSGKVADHPDNAMKFMQEALSNPDQARARFLKAMEILQQQPTTDADKIAAIGYCFGGGVVLNMARAGVDLDGVASFHGSLAPVMQATPGSIKAKILVMHGAEDKLIPAEQVDAFKAEMDAAGADYQFISYPGAMHSFTNPIATEVGEKYQMPLAYNEQADRQSWEQLRQFLQSLWSQN